MSSDCKQMQLHSRTECGVWYKYLENLKEHEYTHTKTQRLLDFGAQKVIWITTKTQKVTVATPNENWQIIDWNKDIELLEGHAFNIGQYLEEEGIDPTAE